MRILEQEMQISEVVPILIDRVSKEIRLINKHNGFGNLCATGHANAAADSRALTTSS